jgi:hypothetical protein
MKTLESLKNILKSQPKVLFKAPYSKKLRNKIQFKAIKIIKKIYHMI